MRARGFVQMCDVKMLVQRGGSDALLVKPISSCISSVFSCLNIFPGFIQIVMSRVMPSALISFVQLLRFLIRHSFSRRMWPPKTHAVRPLAVGIAAMHQAVPNKDRVGWDKIEKLWLVDRALSKTCSGD